MALSIISVTPNTGVSSGRERVVIEGTDFDMHPWPPAAGFVGDLGPSVEVYFDGIQATNVWVYPKDGDPTRTIIECNTPRYVGDAYGLPTAVDVKVKNLLNPGEVTASSAFTFDYVDIQSDYQTGWTYRVHTALLSELKRQIPLEITAARVHTDYDDDTSDGLNVIEISRVPALLVQGPKMGIPSGLYQQHRRIELNDIGDTKRYERPEVRDFEYRFTIVHNHEGILLRLTEMLSNFVEENGYQLKVEKVHGSSTDGFYAIDVDWIEPPEVNQTANQNNIMYSEARFVLRGVPVERPEGIELESVYQADADTVSFDMLDTEFKS